MVKSYLEKCRQELLDQQIDLLNQIQRLDMMRKEKVEMIQYIEASEDKSYDSFSPQSIHVEMNQKSIIRIEHEIQQYQQKIDELSEKQHEIQSRIDEIDGVILYHREKEQIESDIRNQLQEKEKSYGRLFECHELEFQNLAHWMDESLVQRITGMRNRVEFCNKAMDVDRARCKLELQAISDLLSHILADITDLTLELYPLSLEEDGITLIIRKYMDCLSKQSNVNFFLNIKGREDGLPRDISALIFRMFQKVCNMILRYEWNHNIWTDITYGNEIVLSITYDSLVYDAVSEEEKEDYIADPQLEAELELLNQRLGVVSGRIIMFHPMDDKNCIELHIPNHFSNVSRETL